MEHIHIDRVTEANRPAVQAWLVEQGIAQDRVEKMRDGTLYNAYTKPAYLRAILSRTDYTAPSEPAAKVSRIPGSFSGAVNRGKLAASIRLLGSPRQDYPAPSEPSPAVLEAIRALPPLAAPASPRQDIEPSNGADKDTAGQLADIIRQMVNHGPINEQRVIQLIAEHAPRGETTTKERLIVVREQERIELPEEPRHETFPTVLSAVGANIPVMLVGPAGAGKTTLGKQISAALALHFSHTGAIDTRYALSGYEDAYGKYVGTPFRERYEHGGMFLFDECDASDPSALLWCNTAIANGVCAFPDKEVDRHPDFRLIAACNTYGRGADRVYVGRNQLDGATLDRFVVIEFDYDERLERTVFGDTTWTTRVQKVRAAVAQLKLRHVVSPRATLYGAALLAAGLPQTQVEHMTLWKGLEADQIAKVNSHAN